MTAAQQQRIEAAIVAALPTGPGQGPRRVSQLAGELRSFLPGDIDRSTLWAIVQDWHQRAYGSKRKFPQTVKMDFAAGWLRAGRKH